MTIHTQLSRAAGLVLAASVRGSSPVVCSLLLAGATAAAAHGQQIKNVEPYHVTVLRDNTPMKCADGGIFYAVAVLKAGQVLRVDGEGPGWLRVEYLPGMKAHVKASDANLEAGGRTLKLTRPSRLMAANVQAGSRPWQYLLDNDLPAGTTLQVLEAVKASDGTIEGYLVPAPAQARGYVKNDQVRRATPEETAAYVRVDPARTTPTTPTTPDRAAAPAPAQPETRPADPTPAPAQPATDSAQTGTPTQPGGAPAQPAQPPVAVAPPVPKAIRDVELLRTLFDRAMTSAASEDEVKTVIGEFDRTINSLGASETDQHLKRQLTERRKALTLRLDVIEFGRQARAASQAMDERELRVREMVDNIEKQAIYTIVGRIVPSTIYDGRRGMPLMYRVESADSSSTRTLGYVVPGPGVDLLLSSGKVVGIVGESRFDEALRLNLVAARRVVELNPASPARNEPATATGAAEKPGE